MLGGPLHLSSLYRYNFRRIMQAAGLATASKDKFTPKYRLYDLRHTAATLLLRAGENPKVVSERLGHASVAFTMDVYSASLPDMQKEAAEKLETMLGTA